MRNKVSSWRRNWKFWRLRIRDCMLYWMKDCREMILGWGVQVRVGSMLVLVNYRLWNDIYCFLYDIYDIYDVYDLNMIIYIIYLKYDPIIHRRTTKPSKHHKLAVGRPPITLLNLTKISKIKNRPNNLKNHNRQRHPTQMYPISLSYT